MSSPNKAQTRREPIDPQIVEPGWDIVVIARRPVAGASYGAVETAMLDLLEEARLFTTVSDHGTRVCV